LVGPDLSMLIHMYGLLNRSARSIVYGAPDCLCWDSIIDDVKSR
jgi:hypothetical protein